MTHALHAIWRDARPVAILAASIAVFVLAVIAVSALSRLAGLLARELNAGANRGRYIDETRRRSRRGERRYPCGAPGCTHATWEASVVCRSVREDFGDGPAVDVAATGRGGGIGR
jgi:hypothetical protein